MSGEPGGSFDLAGYLVRQIAELREQVAAGDADAAARLRGLETRVDDHDIALTPTQAPADADDDSDDGEPPEPGFPTLEAWVTEHFAQLYPRPLGGPWRWCPRWWDHPEAISRLEALWHSWETLRHDPALGMATWHTQHLDPQLPLLLGAHGPFARCSPDRHEAAKPLPTRPAPHGWWDG